MSDFDQPAAVPQVTRDDSAEDDTPEFGGIPVTPARFSQLQRNGLYGLAPERAIMRVDLQLAPHADLADVAGGELSRIPE